ncbi:MAG: MBL fold metallo-hydrolase, partial [Lachnospiraceae bacterium]|nr:MBL fold metallo-hydrolase [Candidatus Equihabitans merdae]
MRLQILVENTSMGEFTGEHGLSVYVEHAGKKYLIDTGATGLYSENAKKLDVDLSEIDAAFLSHAHYDHSGGYNEFFAANGKVKVYLQSAAKIKQYFKIAGPIKKYIGIPEGILERYVDRFEYVDGYKDMGDGVYILPHTTPGLSKRGQHAHMYGMINGKPVVDDFAHEQTVVFEEEDGLYCFNSCSHGGVDNIIEEVKQVFPNKPIKAFIGGFHMMGTLGVKTCSFSEEEVKQVASKL